MTLTKILIDTNICFDVVLTRKPFLTDAAKIFQRCEDGYFTGMIAAHSFDTIFYVLRKKIGEQKAYRGLRYIRTIFGIADTTETVIDKALQDKWPDFEDAIHYQTALAAGCQAIVTRNPKDFKNSSLPVLSPEEYLNQLS